MEARRLMRVRIDRERCCGNLQCELIAPEVFAADEAGLGVVRVAQPEFALSEQVRVAAASCPLAAIVIEESGD